MKIEGVQIKWLGNSGFQIKNSKVIYLDPYNVRDGLEKADLIFLTHSHYDHCSAEDISKLIQEGTKIIMTADCQSTILRFDIPLKYEIVEPNSELILGNIKVSCLPAYNLDKPFHPKTEEWIGYVIKLDNLILYFAGDTDKIPEMQKLTGYKQNNKKFVALIPVGGRFTMTAEEASDAVNLIKPDLAIPMHYGSVAGNLEDAQEFKELCEEQGNKVEILEKE